ncbi:MAG: hypothetical protein ACREP7_14105, partial [Lysobacter sp.]
MDENGVVSLDRLRRFQDDAAVVETIMQAHCGGDWVPIQELDVTEESMESMQARFARAAGAPGLESRGWHFPVKQWRFEADDGRWLVLTVVDQGRRRFFRY